MTGPRRPPASRTGTATLAGRPAAPKAASGKAVSGKAVSGKGGSKKALSGKAATGKGAGTKVRSGTVTARKPAVPKPAARKPAPPKGRSAVARSTGSGSSNDRAGKRANSRAMSRVDGPRGRRDGQGEEARRRKMRTRARIMVGVAVTVLLVGVLFVAVLPTSTFLDQRSDTDRLEAELAEIEAERAAVADEIERLGTDSEIEAQARRNGYVQPGEEAYNVLPTPIDPIGLPEVWPFTGVEEAMGVR